MVSPFSEVLLYNDNVAPNILSKTNIVMISKLSGMLDIVQMVYLLAFFLIVFEFLLKLFELITEFMKLSIRFEQVSLHVAF